MSHIDVLLHQWPQDLSQISTIIRQLIEDGSLDEHHLDSCIQKGTLKGLTLLQAIACTASQNHPEAFLWILKKKPELLSVSTLTAQVTEGPHEAKSVIWWLAFITHSNPDLFLLTLREHPAAFTPEVIQAPILHGGHKGRSAFWWLAAAATAGNIEPLSALIKTCPAVATTQALMAPARKSKAIGKFPLWLLAFGAAKYRDAKFKELFDRLGEAITPEGLNEPLREGEGQGITPLWWLADFPGLFLQVIKKFPACITHSALTTYAPSHSIDATTILLKLAQAYANNKSSAILHLMKAHANAISIGSLCTTPSTGPDEGRSVIWWLAYAVKQKKTLAFNLILQQYLQAITPASLSVAPQLGSCQGICALGWLILALEHDPQILLWLLAVKPEVITLDSLMAQQKTEAGFEISGIDLLANVFIRSPFNRILALAKKLEEPSKQPHIFQRLIQFLELIIPFIAPTREPNTSLDFHSFFQDFHQRIYYSAIAHSSDVQQLQIKLLAFIEELDLDEPLVQKALNRFLDTLGELMRLVVINEFDQLTQELNNLHLKEESHIVPAPSVITQYRLGGINPTTIKTDPAVEQNEKNLKHLKI